MKKYVVIGSSAAGVNGIRELRKYDKDAEIVLISKDKDIYSRCILHEYLAGKRSIERLRFVEKDFETLYRVNWKKGIEAVGLDRAAKEVILDDGTRESYDKLLIATGSHTFFPPIKNMPPVRAMTSSSSPPAPTPSSPRSKTCRVPPT